MRKLEEKGEEAEKGKTEVEKGKTGGGEGREDVEKGKTGVGQRSMKKQKM